MAAPLILATKSFTEQHILSAMTVQYLQRRAQSAANQYRHGDSRNAMINKQIDMTWEYTGTSLIIFNHINKRMSPQESYETVKRLDAKHGLVWLKPADMNNTYAFAMQRKRRGNISTPCRRWWRRLSRSVKPTRTKTAAGLRPGICRAATAKPRRPPRR
jgi:glycine betaine/choline ABC-type transport system substrate-binding protein